MTALRAWQVQRFGEPSDVLKIGMIQAPVAAAGEVLIDVTMVGLNFLDVMSQAAVPGWFNAGGTGAAGFHGTPGGTGAETATEPDPFSWCVCTQLQASGKDCAALNTEEGGQR